MKSRIPPLFLAVSLLSAQFVVPFPAATSNAFAFSESCNNNRNNKIGPARSGPTTPPESSTVTYHVRMSLSSSPDDNLSASSRERRNEDLRRLSRRDEVVIGKTSARPDARDYDLDPSETERQWAAQANDVEREINAQTERGMRALKMLDLDGADDAFDKVYRLKPNAYLWQAGVVKYYRNELVEAAKCFAENAATFESKFMSPASEERIWRDACELKAASNSRIRTRGKRKGEGEDGAALAMYRDIVKYAPSATVTEGNDGGVSVVSRETRKVLRIVRDLFQGSISNDASAVALNRAKLRSICGEYGSPPTADRKKWKLSSWYYLGLHYDAVGDVDDAKACMKMALRQGASSGNGEDIINMLPFLHMSIRDWFDDDDFTLEDDEELEDEDMFGGATASIQDQEEPKTYAWSSRGGDSIDGGGGSITADTKANNVAEDSDTTKNEFQSIRSKNNNNADADKDNNDGGGARSVVKVAIEASLAKVRLSELKESLRKRGMKTSGSKAELQERLLNALLEDAGF